MIETELPQLRHGFIEPLRASHPPQAANSCASIGELAHGATIAQGICIQRFSLA